MYGAKDADVAAEVPVVPVTSHVLAQVDLGGAVGSADGATNLGLADGSPSVGPQMPLEGLLNGARVTAESATVLLPFVPKFFGAC